jgi:hypothetical protein
MFLIGFPLLLISFAVYNIIAFLIPGLDWANQIAQVRMMSQAEWTLTVSDLLIAASVLLLFVEIAKSARMSTRALVDHMLSLVLFVAMLAEFLLVKEAATATFFLLLVISFVDVVGGFAISVRSARRDIAFEGMDRAPQA